jgi:hypothetical protein
MANTNARKIELAVQTVLSAALGGGFSVRCTNTDANGTTNLALPAVVITATETGVCREIILSGTYAIDATLALENRVNGITAASSAALETLATAAAAAFEGITSNASFSFLQIIDSSDEYAFDGSVRTLTRTYNLKVLTT